MNRLDRATWVLLIFSLGALVGRRWVGDFADAVLTLVALFALGLLVVALLRWAGRRTPVDGTVAPKVPSAWRLATRHLVLASESGRWALRFQNLGRLEYIECRFSSPHIAPFSWGGARRFSSSPDSLGLALFGLGIAIYALTRFYAIDQFPIYFFTDEAIHPVLASDLVQNGMRDAQGRLFPSYFQNGLYWNLSLSVYLHLLPTLLFGKIIWVTRATSALASLSGVVAVALVAKWFLRAKWWWLVVMLLTVAPAWFLHSRTAFETVLMVSFFAWFLLFYLLYRYRSPSYLFGALAFGAATFYAYSNGQIVMGAAGLLLLVSDWRYHLRNWRIGVAGLFLLVVLLIPYLVFRLEHPDAIVSQLRILDSYWTRPVPLSDKLAKFVSNMAFGLSPQYWFVPNEQDLVRHQMKGYGNLPFWLLFPVAVGLLVCLRNLRSSGHRALLITAFVAPVGSALADISITRVLLFVLPASLIALLGIDALVDRIKSEQIQHATAAAIFVLLGMLGFGMLQDSLQNGPTWFTNYGLFGLQWGERQLFTEAIPQYARQNPEGPIYLTSTWANGSDVFLRYFHVTPRVQMFNVDYFTLYKRALDPKSIFIMTKEEFDRSNASGKFKPVQIENTIRYPDGSDGFYFARLSYVDSIDTVFADEREVRRKLVTEKTPVFGETADVAHSPLDIGRIQDMFDGDMYTLGRGMEANPLVIDIRFAQPKAIQSLAAAFGKMDFRWTIQLYSPESDEPVEFTSEYVALPDEPRVEMRFVGGPTVASRVRIEITDLNAVEPAHIHVRELSFR